VKSFLTRGRKTACIAAATAVVASTVVAAVPAQAADKDTIAFSPIALAIPALKGLSEGVKGVGAAKGYNTLILDPNFDPIKQAQQLNAVITSGKIDAGWVISIKPPAIRKTALLAQKKKVPLVLNGVPKDYGFTGPQRGLSFARIDYNKVGAAMGVTAGQCANEKLGGKAEAFFLTSQAGTAGREEQDAATKKWLAQTAPGVTIVQTIEVKDRAGAQKDIAAALQAHPNVKVVTGGNDEGALGALSAFEGAGKTLPCVTENGGNPEVLAAVKDGKIFASAALQFEADLLQTFDELGRLLKTPTAYGKLMSVPVKVIKS
jgi:ABC-type sugar transport system substrate-binding protein